jgi:hypothetical protein
MCVGTGAQSSVRRSTGFTLENGATTMKVLVTIPTYGTKNAGCAKLLIARCRLKRCNVDIVLLCEIRKVFRTDINEFGVYPSRFAVAVVYG